MKIPTPTLIAEQVATALAEDVGSGDLTACLLPEETQASAQVIVRQSAVLCGADWFHEVFRQLHYRIELTWLHQDGDTVSTGDCICTLTGPARALLTGERTALNFLQTLSGTASAAAHYVRTVQDLPVTICDTRKTLPGLRLAQKYAVVCGGASNQRMGLYDAVLLKENHIQSAGSVTQALVAAQAVSAADTMIQIEVENLAELEEALVAGAASILLDNFTLTDLRQAVALNQQRARLEASGGISLSNVRQVAETGVDAISVGDLTKDLQAVDFSMRFLPDKAVCD
ncbi:MAG: carboxylating nicotinate-nucleotide diphosphorylase [Pseudomonadota bacterium]